MVWFCCDYCGDTVKKPKLATHFSHCGSHSFNCVDCCQSFDRKGAQAHSVCLTEAQKYQLGATKPGGTHANGLTPQPQPAAAKAPSEPTGLEFLSSVAILFVHLQHKRRAKAALTAQNGGTAPATPGSDSAQPATPQQQQQQQQEAPHHQQQQQQQEEEQQAPASGSIGEGKSSKKKKRQAPAASSKPESEAGAASASEAGKKAKKAKKRGEASEPDSEADAAAASKSGKKAKKAKKGGEASEPESEVDAAAASKSRKEAKKGGEASEPDGEADAAASSKSGKKAKQAKKRGEPESDADAAPTSGSGKKAKKPKNGEEASEPLHPSLQDNAVMGALQKAVQKKIRAKGSVGPKQLGKVVASKLGLEASEQLVGAVRAELVKRVADIEEQDGFLMPVS
ncbi:hypothetical protein DUNSADRAFT_4559 [Dunaliella salina]|uniref:Zinc finger C2H2 LYAR-type domain-containing protein n=1 Tax=Dunaliella salina TaxID=3046 RepID=A0ABQ7GRR7_DUNSA|nr:hypothetical protein DUNSADRAFT_4559 [Dunaliella salina]|eukprot:KAF5837296.1 hypothetical protein DUNSADRAFT_4559 [Dunaliella salina]